MLQSDTLCTQREVEARVEQVTARYEERIIELHSVIAELRKKLERHHINVIRCVCHAQCHQVYVTHNVIRCVCHAQHYQVCMSRTMSSGVYVTHNVIRCVSRTMSSGVYVTHNIIRCVCHAQHLSLIHI